MSLIQVYCASNVELITRTRTDHLTDQHKTKPKGKFDQFVSQITIFTCSHWHLSIFSRI